MRIRLVTISLAAALNALACSNADTSKSENGDKSGADNSGDFGKADRAGDDCGQKQTECRLEEYAPVTCQDGRACVGRVPLESRPNCGAKPDYSIAWSTAYHKHIYDPWFQRYGAARTDFMLKTSPD